MSRIGKQPIPVSDGVTVSIADGVVTVNGPKGELTQALHPHVTVEEKDGAVNVTVKKPDEKQDRALWGLTRALVANMVHGVTEGFEKKLEVNGVGYKAAVQGKKLVLHLGYSHPIEYEAPKGIEMSIEKNVITVSGADKQLVGESAAQIRGFRKPEPYKGKGVKYLDEQIRRKVGKVVKGADSA